jgi:hypothetical protein
LTVVAAIASWRATIIVIAITRGWAAAAIAFHRSAPSWGPLTVAIRAIAGRGVGATHFMIVVTIVVAWGAVGAAEAAAGAIAIAKSRRWAIGADVAFNKAAFQPAFEVTFEVTARRTIGSWTTIGSEAGTFRRGRHVLVDVFRKSHELFFAQFAVTIFVELREHLLRLWHFRWASVVAVAAIMMTIWTVTFRTMAISIVAIAIFAIVMSAVLIAFAIVTSLTMAFAHEFTHFLAGFLTFVVAQLAVIILVEFLHQLFADFSAGGAIVLVGIFGVRLCCHHRNGQQTGGCKGKASQ